VNLNTVSGSAVELSEVAFGREFNEALVHQVVTAYQSGLAVVKLLLLVHKTGLKK